jgi:hypothetical protein
MVSFSALSMERVYTFVMGLARFRTNARAGFEANTSTDAPKLGPTPRIQNFFKRLTNSPQRTKICCAN